jgi:hypothetical protein
MVMKERKSNNNERKRTSMRGMVMKARTNTRGMVIKT